MAPWYSLRVTEATKDDWRQEKHLAVKLCWLENVNPSVIEEVSEEEEQSGGSGKLRRKNHCKLLNEYEMGCHDVVAS